MTIEQALRHEHLGNLPLSKPATVPPGTSLEATSAAKDGCNEESL